MDKDYDLGDDLTLPREGDDDVEFSDKPKINWPGQIGLTFGFIMIAFAMAAILVGSAAALIKFIMFLWEWVL